MKDLISKIESELARRDCNAGELKDTTGASYPEIFTALQRLSSQDKVTYYFLYITPLPTLTYKLKKHFWHH